MKTTLYYKDGSSDKIYQCETRQVKGGYVVDFAYGRRGSTLKTGTKTSSPVTEEEANTIYNKLVREKTAKGYTEGEDGKRYSTPEFAGKESGYPVQLLNFIELDEVNRLILNKDYCAQEKFDGERMVLSKQDGEVSAGNKLGLLRAYPECLVEAMTRHDITYDGEIVGEVYHAFDVLHYQGVDTRNNIYLDRLARLPSMAPTDQGPIRTVYTAYTTKDKQVLFDKLKKEGREGIVFKLLSAKYTPGRPASGGSQLKFKFYATASCIVVGVNQKRSVSLGLMDGAVCPVEVGNVTIPPNKDIPKAGQVVEVRYLYAYRGGSLFQPTYLGPRTDVLKDECTFSQLKYKNP